MFVFSRSHLSHLQQQAANSKEKLEGMNQVIHVVAFSSGHWWRCQIIQLVSLKLQPFFWHHWLFFIPCDHCLKPGLPTFISTAAGPHREDRDTACDADYLHTAKLFHLWPAAIFHCWHGGVITERVFPVCWKATDDTRFDLRRDKRVRVSAKHNSRSVPWRGNELKDYLRARTMTHIQREREKILAPNSRVLLKESSKPSRITL